jgi:hypothetical protein
MSSGIDNIYDSIFHELNNIENILVTLRGDNLELDDVNKTRIQYIEEKKSELYRLYNSVYKDSSTTIINKLRTIETDVNNIAGIAVGIAS